MIPIIFLTETQLEPAEVKWMHGVRMREIYGIDVLRHAEQQGRLAGATAHYTWPAGAGSSVSWLRDATRDEPPSRSRPGEKLRRSRAARPKVIGSGAFFSA